MVSFMPFSCFLCARELPEGLPGLVEDLAGEVGAGVEAGEGHLLRGGPLDDLGPSLNGNQVVEEGLQLNNMKIDLQHF